MLGHIVRIDEPTIDQLFDVYAESMADLSASFADAGEMRASYREFLEEFVASSGQFVLVEEHDGVWVSALRAVPFGQDSWFIEAVETTPTLRRRGCGHKLLLHAKSFLKTHGAREVCCIIAPENVASRRLHEGCGFAETDEPPINPWGETEDGCILYRCIL